MTLSIQERIELRKTLLIDLYDYYFSNSGAPYHTNRDFLQQNKETDLAYQYLANKHLISVEKQGRDNIYIKLTVHGIDLVEASHPNRFDLSESKSNEVQHVEENPAKAYTEW